MRELLREGQAAGEMQVVNAQDEQQTIVAASDADAFSGAVSVTLSTSDGILTVSPTTGLAFVSGDNGVSATLVFTAWACTMTGTVAA